MVRLYDFFIRKRMAYVVMERVRGFTLTRAIERRGAFRPRKVVDIALSILNGLDALHRCGFVHGDLHSKNVILTHFKTGQTKIIDFQHAARKNQDGKARARRILSRPPHKLAPESRRRMIDDSYDIYSVGFLCACMLRGRELKRRPRRTKIRAGHVGIWRVIRKAMRRNPKRRYRSAQEMMQALLVASDDAVARDQDDQMKEN